MLVPPNEGGFWTDRVSAGANGWRAGRPPTRGETSGSPFPPSCGPGDRPDRRGGHDPERVPSLLRTGRGRPGDPRGDGGAPVRLAHDRSAGPAVRGGVRGIP